MIMPMKVFPKGQLCFFLDSIVIYSSVPNKHEDDILNYRPG